MASSGRPKWKKDFWRTVQSYCEKKSEKYLCRTLYYLMLTRYWPSLSPVLIWKAKLKLVLVAPTDYHVSITPRRNTYSRSSPRDHSRKRPALVTTIFVKPRFNCDLNFVMKISLSDRSASDRDDFWDYSLFLSSRKQPPSWVLINTNI